MKTKKLVLFDEEEQLKYREENIRRILDAASEDGIVNNFSLYQLAIAVLVVLDNLYDAAIEADAKKAAHDIYCVAEEVQALFNLKKQIH